MRFRARHFLIAVLLLAALPARAQSGKEAAREAAEQGRREYNLGRWQQAVEAFEKAYQLSGDAALLFNLAQAHRQLGHPADALRLYRAFLREMPNAPNRAVAEKQIKELEAQTGARAPAAPPNAPPATTPPPARPPAASPAPAPAVPPSPPPPASKPGPPPPAGATAAPPPAKPATAPPPATSPPPATAPPPAKPATAPPPAKSPPPATSPPPTTAPAPALAPAAGPAPSPAPAAAVSISSAPSPPPTRRPLPRWVPIVSAGVTVALATGAIITGMSASKRFDDLQMTCGQTTAGCRPDEIDSVKSKDRTTTILWVATGVFAAVTGVTVYVNTREGGVSALWRY